MVLQISLLHVLWCELSSVERGKKKETTPKEKNKKMLSEIHHPLSYSPHLIHRCRSATAGAGAGAGAGGGAAANQPANQPASQAGAREEEKPALGRLARWRRFDLI
jgi:hypothetical protein